MYVCALLQMSSWLCRKVFVPSQVKEPFNLFTHTLNRSGRSPQPLANILHSPYRLIALACEAQTSFRRLMQEKTKDHLHDVVTATVQRHSAPKKGTMGARNLMTLSDEGMS